MSSYCGIDIDVPDVSHCLPHVGQVPLFFPSSHIRFYFYIDGQSLSAVCSDPVGVHQLLQSNFHSFDCPLPRRSLIIVPA
jgi:hypothetical protein